MKTSGYYEIVHHTEALTGLKMRAMAGNVQFNRLHWHDALEIMCCLHGSFSMRLPSMSISEKRHSRNMIEAYSTVCLQPGDIITIGSGIPHEIFDGTNDGLQLIFSVDPSLLRAGEGKQYLFSTVTPESALSKDDSDVAAVRNAIARLVCYLPPESDEHWYLLHQELYRILAVLSRHKSDAPVSVNSIGPFSRFLQCVEIIHDNYEKPISAAFVAAEIGFSEPTVYRLFQTHMGMSFTEYLNSIRVSKACGLLTQSVFRCPDMTELAAECGFASLSNFYRAFHQFTGMSPRDYRKLSLKDIPERSSLTQPLIWQTGFQHELLQLNRFQPLTMLPESYSEDIRRLAFF